MLQYRSARLREAFSNRSDCAGRFAALAQGGLALILVGGLAATCNPARATCTTAGLTVTCTGPAPFLTPSFSSATNDLTVNVTPTGTVSVFLGLVGTAMSLTGNNTTLNNAGTIDPNPLGLTGLLVSGVAIGNPGPSTVNVNNSGTINGTSGLLGLNLLDLTGMALAVQNGATGITTIVNSGTIGATPLLGLSLLGSDAPVVAAYGGATVNMVNTGTINGRVAFEPSATGNSFVNGGVINGSVALGPASTNQFTVVTGSSVNNGGSLGLNVLNVVGLNLGFAATGVVDGGAGGNNELLLQNSATGTGSGLAGAGTLTNGTYINFNRLTVNSGTWTLNGGPVVSGSSTLNGGLVNFDSGNVFGSGVLSANGGAIAPLVGGLTVANAVSLSGAGLSVQGANGLALSGVLSGGGALGMSGTGTLQLGNSNTFGGGTDLASGTLQLLNAGGLGAGALRASGGTLDVVPAATLANDVVLGGNLALSGTAALTLAGTVSGAGGLIKNGASTLTLTGANGFGGGLTLAAGGLVLGNNGALGTGALTAAAGTTLDASAAVSVANAVTLNGSLGIGGSNALALTGNIGGAGGLVKNGAADLTLAGTNAFVGGVSLNAGRLIVGSSTALGTGTLTATGGTTLDASAAVSLANNVSLVGNLTLGGSSPLTLAGNVSGAGGLIKAGLADATLSGTNSFNGPVSVAAGALNTVGNAALGNTPSVDIAAGAALRLGGNAGVGSLTGAGALDVGAGATLTLGTGGASSVFGGSLSGAGNLAKASTGTLTLNGTGALGSTAVTAGRLLVGDNTHAAATLGGAVSVAAGATLGGTGTVGGNVTVASGGVLAPGDGTGSLSVGGSLTLAQGSAINVGLGAASGSATVPGVGNSVSVAGDLALNGSTVNIGNLGGYGPGLYRLFDYAGTLSTTNGGLALGTTPGVAPLIQYLSGPKQINLVNAAGFTLNMWNANGAAGPTQMGGGSGTWSVASPVWTDAVGSVTAPMQPMPGFGVFGGQSGTVTVDNGGGAVSALGLQFAVDGYTLTGGPLGLTGSTATPAPHVNVGDGSAAGAGYTATIDSVLTGSDGIDKVGAGTLVLNGANTYTGTTTLSAGVLSVAADAGLGAAANALDFEGGTLRVTGAAVPLIARSATLGAAGGTIDIADAGSDVRLSQPIGGAGALIKAGAGTLTLTGANAYAGGTTIAAGTLQLGNGGGTGSIAGNVVDNGVLAFNRADDLVFAGAISGSGSVSQRGAGTTTLSGANSYTGGTAIVAGTLAGTAASFGSGAIANNAALRIEATTDAAMANVLTGTGSITKTGGGSLLLTGDSGAFAGATGVTAGTLAVQGALGGTLAIAGGATLAGTGTVGTTTVLGGGTIAPGNGGIGTLNVNGNLVLAQGSLYRIDVSPTASDQILVSGTATLQGGSVLALGANGNWDPSATYRILRAAGGLGGVFGGVSSNFAFLTPTIAYDATTASLTLARNDVPFTSLATTPNQGSAGAAIESLPSAAPLYNAVVQLDAPSARAAFQQLAGDTHATLRGAMLDGSHYVRDAMVDRLRESEGSAASPADASVQRGDRNLWVRGFGAWGRIGSDGNASRMQSSVSGVFVGADTRIADGWRVGVVGGYSRARYKVDDRSASATDSAYHLGVYGGRQWDRLALRMGASYTHHGVDTSRTVVFPGVFNSLGASYRARTAQVFGELGYRIDAGMAALEPFANLAYADLRTSGFLERGGVAAVSSRSGSMGVGFSTLGLRASAPVAMGGADVSVRGMVGWRHAFGDVTPTSTLAFAGGSDFAVNGLPIARNALVVEAGVDLNVDKNLKVGIAYTGQTGGGVRDHGVKATLLWKF